MNPLFDETGALAKTAQPNAKAFYLVGVINASNTASRSITIPEGTPLFGPVVNLQNDNVYNDVPLTVPQPRAQAAGIVDTASIFLELDGESRLDLVSRIKSPVFDYVLPAEGNIYQFFGDGHLRAHQALRLGRVLVLHPAAAAGDSHVAIWWHVRLLRDAVLRSDRVRDYGGVNSERRGRGEWRRVALYAVNHHRWGCAESLDATRVCGHCFC